MRMLYEFRFYRGSTDSILTIRDYVDVDKDDERTDINALHPNSGFVLKSYVPCIDHAIPAAERQEKLP